MGRFGGDEFAVLLTNTSAEELKNTLNRLSQAVDKFNQEEQRGYDIAYSVGAVQFDAVSHTDIAELIVEADVLMYKQKKQRHCEDSIGHVSKSRKQAAI